MASLCNQIGKYFSGSRSSDLCETCSNLDLHRFFRGGLRESDDPIILGALSAILYKKDTCGLCHLISLAFLRGWRLDLHPDEDLTSVQVRLLVAPCGWADSAHYSLYGRNTSLAHGIDLDAVPPLLIRKEQMKLNMSLTSHLQMMEDDAERFGRKRAFHGRRVKGKVSIKRIKEWLRICEKEHGLTCGDVWKDVIEQLPRGVKMIDVVQMAVVEAPRDCRYVALSYVWGNISTEYQTLSVNVAQRRKRNSLKNVELPETIVDAIKLVQKLEERYLWVDALCIIQDDDNHKDAQIAGMHTIYGAAALTIFAASGDSAQAPLPGLEPGSRQRLQDIQKIQSLQLTVPLKNLQETLAAVKWNMRGWIFQEYMLSRRRLFFTNEQVFFECEREEFSEDVIVESSTKSGMYPAKYCQGLPSSFLRARGRPKYEDRLYEVYAIAFMKVVEAYSVRQLTNAGDIYNAVLALITVFSRSFEKSPMDPNQAFLFGMPMSLLEDAMLWQPALDAPAHERRFVEGLVTPSWSWAGWMGGVVYFDEDRQSINLGQPASYQSLVDDWVIGDPKGQARRVSTVRPLRRKTFFKHPVKYIGVPSPPLVEEGDDLAPGTLLFYTTAAFLRVRKIAMSKGSGAYDSKFHSIFEIVANTPSIEPPTMGRIVLPTNIDTSEPLEFIVLSRAAVSHHSLFDQQVFGESYMGCLLNVMAIRRVWRRVNGMDMFHLHERVGVGLIVEAGWLATGFEERMVFLE